MQKNCKIGPIKDVNDGKDFNLGNFAVGFVEFVSLVAKFETRFELTLLHKVCFVVFPRTI